jgi:hypothetical protein
MFRTIRIIFTLLLYVMITAVASWAQEYLAKQSQNPIGNLISVPFENNTNFGV